MRLSATDCVSVEKYDKKHGSFKSCINPDCTYLHTAGDEVEN